MTASLDHPIKEFDFTKFDHEVLTRGRHCVVAFYGNTAPISEVTMTSMMALAEENPNDLVFAKINIDANPVLLPYTHKGDHIDDMAIDGRTWPLVSVFNHGELQRVLHGDLLLSRLRDTCRASMDHRFFSFSNLWLPLVALAGVAIFAYTVISVIMEIREG